MPRLRAFLAVLACGLAGCSYDPPMPPGHDPAAFKTDLAACQEAGSKEADRRVKATFPRFITYPISLPIEIRMQTRKCLEAKGYNLDT